MKLYLLAATAALIATAALASPPGNNGGGQGGCGVGQQTNGCGTAPTTPSATAGAAALGVGVGIGVGQGGDAKAQVTNVVAPVVAPDIRSTVTVSPDIRVSPVIAPVIAPKQDQGQLQGQLQGQQQAATSSSQSASTSAAKSDQTQAQGIDSKIGVVSELRGGDQSINATGSGNETSVVVEGDAYRRNVASAYAAPLAIGGGVCAYTPASVAVQLPGFGGSGGVGKIDQGCETRATADMFARLGMSYEACLIMVSQPASVRAGLKRETCVVPPPKVVIKYRDRLIKVDPPVATEADGEKG